MHVVPDMKARAASNKTSRTQTLEDGGGSGVGIWTSIFLSPHSGAPLLLVIIL